MGNSAVCGVFSTGGLDVSYKPTKINPEKTVRATTIPRPPLESPWSGESRSAWSIFVNFIFDLFFQNNFPNYAQTKVNHEDLDSPRQIFVPWFVRESMFNVILEVKLICVRSIKSCSCVPAII